MTTLSQRPADRLENYKKSFAVFLLLVGWGSRFTNDLYASAAESYSPEWASDLSWASKDLFHRPLGASAWLENQYTPWWQNQVAHPIDDYSGAKLQTGVVRLDTAVDVNYTNHRLLQGWTKQSSPSAINNVYTFSPGSSHHEDRTARSGQTAFLDVGLHPLEHLSGDIGAEFIGNYDQRYWFPVNDEHRMYNNNQQAKIVRGEIKYDNSNNFMIRAYEGTQQYDWIGQNDLFGLLPAQTDVEYYRQEEGSLTPRGGEVRVKTAFGTLDVLGGSEPRLGYGSGGYAKYDAPVMRGLEQSLVYRNENIPFGLESTDERRWSLSYNASYPWSDRIVSHAGLLYQPFRLNRPFRDPTDILGGAYSTFSTTKESDGIGGTLRTEFRPTLAVDEVGVGYMYLGPIAGNKQQVDADVSKTFFARWTLSGGYIYRQPVIGPIPLVFEGTAANPGALLSTPRGQDDPFWVQWDNRQAHIASLTMVYDPTPGTPFFKHQKNVLDEWNLSADEDAPFSAAVQYRMTDYLTNTDRLYYYNEDRTVVYDPVAGSGALASAHPLSSATGLARWRLNDWRLSAELSGGEAFAGSAITYTAATNFYKPSTAYMSGGVSLDNGIVKTFFNYGQNVWGPMDYQTSLGWAYSRVYQAGISYILLRDLETGFRFIGTRMKDEFIGSDTGAFNEYSLYFTYHFSLQHNFGSKIAALGKPIPQTIPEASVSVSPLRFTPDGSGPDRTTVIALHAASEAGLLSWRVFVRNSTGETVHSWEGSGTPPAVQSWDGLAPNGQPLPAGQYRLTLDVSDLYGNDVTSPAQIVEIQAAAPKPTGYSVSETDEGLRVTMSSLILFDVNQDSLKPTSKEGLDQVIELLKAYPTNRLRITGHTDATGSATHNQRLSERRAHSVANYLITKGIQRSRISMVGLGLARPLATNSTEEGRQQNRRVEIDILK